MSPLTPPSPSSPSPYVPGEGTITFRVDGRGIADLTYSLTSLHETDAVDTTVTAPSLPWFTVADARGIGVMPMLTITLDTPGAYADIEIVTDGTTVVRGRAEGPATTAVFMARAQG